MALKKHIHKQGEIDPCYLCGQWADFERDGRLICGSCIENEPDPFGRASCLAQKLGLLKCCSSGCWFRDRV